MRVFIIAGEASGDKLGAALMAGLKTLASDVEFRGIGGVGMAELGLQSQFSMSELSLMGIAEILPKYFHLKRRIRETAAAALAWNPDVVVTIDAPDFCLRVAKAIKAADTSDKPIKIVHYVAPSVWAWRPKRAVKMARFVDHVMALLPFEPAYMQAAGMGASFVGHPVAAELVATNLEAASFRTRHGLEGAKTLLVLPGSRKGEIARLGPVFGEVLQSLCAAQPDLRVIVPVAQGVEDAVHAAVQGWPGQPILLGPNASTDRRAAFKAADAALAASGTVALELAAAGTPMVIAYDFNILTWLILRAVVLIDSVNLVNLVSETRVVPELLGGKCRARFITPAITELLANPGGQIDAMNLTMERLGKGGRPPGLRAAQAVIDVVRQA